MKLETTQRRYGGEYFRLTDNKYMIEAAYSYMRDHAGRAGNENHNTPEWEQPGWNHLMIRRGEHLVGLLNTLYGWHAIKFTDWTPQGYLAAEYRQIEIDKFKTYSDRILDLTKGRAAFQNSKSAMLFALKQ